MKISALKIHLKNLFWLADKLSEFRPRFSHSSGIWYHVFVRVEWSIFFLSGVWSRFCSCGVKHFSCLEYDITFLFIWSEAFFSCLEYDILFLFVWSKTLFPVSISPWHVFCDADVASLQHPSLPIQETSGHSQVRKIRPKNILSVLEVFKSNNNRFAATYFWSSVHSGNLDVGVQDVSCAFVCSST